MGQCGNRMPEGCRRQAAIRLPLQQEFSLIGRPDAEQQLGQCRLARAAGSDDGRMLSRLDREGESMQEILTGSIGKTEILYAKERQDVFAAACGRNGCRFPRFFGGGDGQEGLFEGSRMAAARLRRPWRTASGSVRISAIKVCRMRNHTQRSIPLKVFCVTQWIRSPSRIMRIRVSRRLAPVSRRASPYASRRSPWSKAWLAGQGGALLGRPRLG